MSETPQHRTPAVVAAMQTISWEGDLPGRIRSAFADVGLLFRTYANQNFVEVPLPTVHALIAFLQDQEQFDMLTDSTAVDRPSNTERFELIYILYSFERNEYVRVKTRAALDEAVPSLSDLFVGADWMEREIFDMFGIPFTGHPNLKRILMPEDWNGFPLRKDHSIIGMDNEWVRNNLGIESGQS